MGVVLTGVGVKGEGADFESEVCERGLFQCRGRSHQHNGDTAVFDRQLQASHHGGRAAIQPAKDNADTAAASCLFEGPECFAVNFCCGRGGLIT